MEELKPRKEIPVTWVKPGSNLARYIFLPNEVAVTIPGKGVYALEKKASQGDVEHEKYHFVKRHTSTPRDPGRLVEQELLANLYSYSRGRKPRSMLRHFRGIIWSLGKKYGLNFQEAVEVIRQELDGLETPIRWIRDLDYLVKETEEGREVW